jgi:hypothetical protein
MVFPQTPLGHISIAPWTDRLPPMEKKRNRIISNNNKEAGWRKQEGWNIPSNQERESLKKWRWEEKSTRKGGRTTSHVSCK